MFSFKDLFGRQSDKEEEVDWERQRSCSHWFFHQMTTMATVRLGWHQQPGPPSRSFTFVTRAQILGPSLNAFLGALAGSWIRSGKARTWIGSIQMWCSQSRQWPSLLHYNTDLMSGSLKQSPLNHCISVFPVMLKYSFKATKFIFVYNFSSLCCVTCFMEI